jgi:hypothetical protein
MSGPEIENFGTAHAVLLLLPLQASSYCYVKQPLKTGKSNVY